MLLRHTLLAFAVAERLWSAQDVTDEGNMSRRLAAVDRRSVVSARIRWRRCRPRWIRQRKRRMKW
ncbi:hypothetical protein J2125_001630 [Erwinia toletana]|uniref:Secreted protein n=1 Tax=Winslowiella toletana TaxID=92490 RepID=A0ABS4P706_9GAMM|nr:hypothetical protein [Winslowiella toletana]MBP2168438.1 hypothetical protein [Winslowiella toletana]